MEKTVTVLDKHLKDGRRLVLTYGQHPEYTGVGFHAELDGEGLSTFSTWIRRDAADLPETPHVIEIPHLTPRPKGAFGAPVGLTPEEAGQIDAAVDEYHNGHKHRALEAAPDAATWTTTWQPLQPDVGATYRDGQGRLVTVVGQKRTWTEDGPSFHLATETGNLYAAVVREATPDEVAAWEASQDEDRRLTEAFDVVEKQFSWDATASSQPDARRAARTEIDETAESINISRGEIHSDQNLVRSGGYIYSYWPSSSSLQPDVCWRYPATRERAEAFEAIAELLPFRHRPARRKRGRPPVSEGGSTQVTVALPNDTVAALDEWADRQGRKRAQVLRELITDGVARRRVQENKGDPDA